MDDVEVPTRKWTRLEYDRLIEAEFFRPDDRIELVGGHMIVKEPQYSPHAVMVSRVERVLRAAFGPGWYVRTQMPLALDDESEPEPDLVVVPGEPDDYFDAHPTSAVLIVEVSLSRLRFDRREKSSLYARARIADYWIVNIPDHRLEVYRQPIPDGAATFGWRYGTASALGPEQHVTPLALTAASIAVVDLLPRLTRR